MKDAVAAPVRCHYNFLDEGSKTRKVAVKTANFLAKI